MLKTLKFAIVAALLAVPITVHAQDIFGGMQRGAFEGMERGAAEGNAAAGSFGRIVGGVVGSVAGSVVGAANGVIDINPEPRIYEHRSAYRGHRHHRFYH